MIERRTFIAGLGAAAAWPLATRGQQAERIRRVGVLSAFAEVDPAAQASLRAFRQALQKLGWTDGSNVRIETRWGDANPTRIRAQVKEIAGLNPDVFLISTALVLQPLLEETRSTPIVFTQIADPLSAGIVASLARPGGNVTGFAAVPEFATFGKLLEVLKEAAPHVTRVAVVLNPDQTPQAGMLRAIEANAPTFKVQVTAAGARNANELETTVDQFAREPNGGLIVLPNPVTLGNQGLIIELATRHRLPAVYSYRSSVAEGGLISYGVDLLDQHRQAASYVDRILKGEKPADLPVQLPTKLALVINLKTAKALGLTLPPALLSLADEVIE
jgi:putative tryptophan/tyrosine transport system substrate-binding protein